MKNLLLAALLCAPLPAAAEEWTLLMKAVKGRYAYARSLPLAPGKAAAFDGKLRPKGGEERQVSFDALLLRRGAGCFAVDYAAEVAGDNRARPLFEVKGKLPLRPGKAVVAAAAGGWKLVLELEGPAAGGCPGGGDGTLKARLKCRGGSYAADFVYLPEAQYSASLYEEEGDSVRKFLVGLLPGTPGFDGSFFLQYTALLAEAGEERAASEGRLTLAPGASRSARAGDGCSFSVKAAR